MLAKQTHSLRLSFGANLFALLISSGLWLAASPAGGALIQFAISLDGAQQVPANVSPGTGTGTASYNDVTHVLSWNISFSGLTGAATAMHFHGPAAVGVNSGVQVNIGAISGLTSPTIGNTVITAGQGADLVNELWYVNIHTLTFPPGEIRGQVLMVPEPSAALLGWIVGLAFLGSRRRPGRQAKLI